MFGLFSDRLTLPSETIVGDELLEKTKREIGSRGGDFVPTIKLDGRDFQAAVFMGLTCVARRFTAQLCERLSLGKCDWTGPS